MSNQIWTRKAHQTIKALNWDMKVSDCPVIASNQPLGLSILGPTMSTEPFSWTLTVWVSHQCNFKLLTCKFNTKSCPVSITHRSLTSAGLFAGPIRLEVSKSVFSSDLEECPLVQSHISSLLGVDFLWFASAFASHRQSPTEPSPYIKG